MGGAMTTPKPAMTTPKPAMKLVVDTEQRRVVYAECDRDMADVLLSFLVTPVGAIVRLSGKSSGLGCMDSLYQSVEKLSPDQFETEACQGLLLRPRNAFGFAYNKLKLQINDVNEAYYLCPSLKKCHVTTIQDEAFVSTVAGATCGCGRKMVPQFFISPPDREMSEAVFIRSEGKYIVTDELRMERLSVEARREACRTAGVRDSTRLRERVVLVDREQVVRLLTRSLVSTTPLTDTFLATRDEEGEARNMNRWISTMPLPVNSTSKTKSITVFLDKTRSRIVHAKADFDLINCLLSILTLPIGSIIHIFGGSSSLGCIDNLYKSVQRLEKESHLLARMSGSPPYKSIAGSLLNPSPAPHHCYRPSRELFRLGTPVLTMRAKNSVIASLKFINPKYPGAQTQDWRGGYLKSPSIFTITDGLVIEPLSTVTTATSSGLEARNIDVGKEEAIKLLRASLVLQNPLTHVLLEMTR